MNIDHRKTWSTRAKLCCEWIVSAFFLLSASFKVAEPSILPMMLAQLPTVPPLPPLARHTMSGAIVGLEAFVGVALLLRFQVRLALVIATFFPMLLALVVAPFYEALGGDCGCVWRWVPFAPTTGLELVARNVLLASLSLGALQLQHSRQSLPNEEVMP